MKTALLFGASGLVGSHVLNQLISNNNYSKIKLFVRSSINMSDPKIEIIQTDFNNLENHREDIKGMIVFFVLVLQRKIHQIKMNIREWSLRFQNKSLK